MKSTSHGQGCRRQGWRGGWQEDISALAKSFNLIFHCVPSCCFPLFICTWLHCPACSSSHHHLLLQWTSTLEIYAFRLSQGFFSCSTMKCIILLTFVSGSDHCHQTDDSTSPSCPSQLNPSLHCFCADPDFRCFSLLNLFPPGLQVFIHKASTSLFCHKASEIFLSLVQW